jgi:hypothetical protein
MQVFSVLILHCLMHFRCIIEVSYLCHNGLNQHQDLGLIIFSSLNFLCTVEVNYLNHSGLDQHPDSGLSFILFYFSAATTNSSPKQDGLG